MKHMMGLSAGLVAGAIVGTAVCLAVKQMSRPKHCTCKAKRMTAMAFDAMGEAFHNLATHVK